MLRRTISAGALFALASLAAADGPTLPLLFHDVSTDESPAFESRSPGLAARFDVGGFSLLAGGAAVRVGFEGSNSAPTGLEPSSTRVHRLLGADAADWRLDASSWKSLQFTDVWPGIGVRIHTHQGRIEFDLQASPGADLSSAVLHFECAGTLQLDERGALIVPTEAGELFLAPPVTWEERADGATFERACRYELLGDARARLVVEGWDGAHPLVVDPVLVWSRYVGGTSGDEATAVAVDESGAFFVTGWTRSGDFPVSGDAFDRKRASEEAFLAKLEPDGRTLAFVTYFGGRDVDRGQGIAVDRVSGEIVVVGRTQSSDFPTTSGVFRTGRSGVRDGFVVRFAADGRSLRYGTYLGGSGGDELVDVELTPTGEAVVLGTTTSSDFPTTAGALQMTSGGRDDAFVARLDAEGQRLLAATYVGGSRDEVAGGLALDAESVWLVGTTRSSDFPVSAGAHDVTRNDHDGFVARVSLDLATLRFATFLGGRDRDEATDVAVFSYLGAVVVGRTRSNDFPITPDAFQSTRRGLDDGFLTLVNWNGTTLLHSTFLGGSADETVTSVGVDDRERAWVAGMTYSSDWAMTGDAAQAALVGAGDAFLACYDPRTGARDYATLLGGDAEDQILDLAVDPLGGSTAVVGYARTGLPNVVAGTPFAPAGARDAFMARFDHGTCDDLASVTDLGGGCGMQLNATSARLGRRMTLAIEGAPAHSMGMFLASAPTEDPLVLGDGCLAMVDVSRMWVLGSFQVDEQGNYTVQFDVQGDDVNCGNEITVQAIVISPGQGPSGVGWLSNAKGFVLGN